VQRSFEFLSFATFGRRGCRFALLCRTSSLFLRNGVSARGRCRCGGLLGYGLFLLLLVVLLGLAAQTRQQLVCQSDRRHNDPE